MLHFIFYGIVAFIIYQFAISVDWGDAADKTNRKVDHAAEDAVDAVRNTGVTDAIMDLINP